MDKLEEFGYATTFNSAYDIVQTPLNQFRQAMVPLRDAQRAYLERTRVFFKGIVDGFCSTITNGRTYELSDDLYEVLKMLTGRATKPVLISDLQEGRERAEWLAKSLEALAKNPDEFYKDAPNVKRVAEVLRNFRAFYAPYHQVMVCRGTSEPEE